MASSGMLRRVSLVKPDVSEELSASFIRVTRIGELGTALAVTSNRRTLRRNTISVSVLTRATRPNIPEDTILHSHHCENLKSYYQFSYAVFFDFQVAILIFVVTSVFGHQVWAFSLPGGISAGQMFELTFYICAIASNLPMSLWNIYK
jgi:hypothetical protein